MYHPTRHAVRRAGSVEEVENTLNATCHEELHAGVSGCHKYFRPPSKQRYETSRVRCKIGYFSPPAAACGTSRFLHYGGGSRDEAGVAEGDDQQAVDFEDFVEPFRPLEEPRQTTPGPLIPEESDNSGTFGRRLAEFRTEWCAHTAATTTTGADADAAPTATGGNTAAAAPPPQPRSLFRRWLAPTGAEVAGMGAEEARLMRAQDVIFGAFLRIEV